MMLAVFDFLTSFWC